MSNAPDKPIHGTRAAPMNDSLALHRIFQHLEGSPRTLGSIDALAHEFGIRRRGLYDFISICSVFGICKRISNNQVEWDGANRSLARINAIRSESQQESSESKIKEVFNYYLDASLQRIAVGLVKLFFYLRVKFLDLRQVSRLFAQRTTKYKTMLRKVYTVATSLEIVGIVKKTTVVSEIQLSVPLDSEDSEKGLKVSSILNSKEQIELQKLGEKRRRDFEVVCTELKESQKTAEVPEGMKPMFKSLGPCA
jgi:hypothetical protein